MRYGSPFYLAMIALLLLGLFAIWHFLKKLSAEKQKLFIFIIMLVNTLQHLFKWAIYPIYWNQGFTVLSLSTAYNMCALLILLMPFALFSKSITFRDFMFIAGAFAGLVTNLVPFWHIGKRVSELGWEYVRFYFCHALLFYSGMLPLLLGFHKISYRRSYKIGFGFLISISIILLNDIIAIALGLFDYPISDLYGSLCKINPCMAMKPSAEFPILDKIAKVLSPDVFTGKNRTGVYVPILWYAIPAYLGFTILSFTVLAVFDRKNFINDMRAIRKRLKK